MEILLLGIYAFFVWLIFFKFKLLPWNIVSQVIVVTIPIFGIAALILFLNIYAPSSHDIRVINYVVPVNPRVAGLVTEVPVEPNRPVKKGDVLFRLDPTPFEIAIRNIEARLNQQFVELISAEASARNLGQELRGAAGQKQAVEAQLALARQRVGQLAELAESGAGNRFDLEQAEADVRNLEGQLESSRAAEAQVRERISAKTPDGEQDEVAVAKARIRSTEAELAQAQWNLDQTVYRAPTDGTVVAITLRPGAMAVPLPMVPAMNFVENEQWILAIYQQNEVRNVKPGQEAEIAFKMYPGTIVKAKVDSIIWATAQGQLPIGTMNPSGGLAPIPANSLAVRLLPAEGFEELFLAAGAHGAGAVYTDGGHAIHIVRKVIVRVGAKLDWLILKLH
jgi:multidrug resistance efflux pump